MSTESNKRVNRPVNECDIVDRKSVINCLLVSFCLVGVIINHQLVNYIVININPITQKLNQIHFSDKC